jgi:hypothetical protein
MPLAGFVINRVHPSRPVALEVAALAERLAGEVAALELQPGTLRIAAEAMLASHAEQELLARSDAASIERVGGEIDPSVPVAQVPQLDRDVHDVERLAELGAYLMA